MDDRDAFREGTGEIAGQGLTDISAIGLRPLACSVTRIKRAPMRSSLGIELSPSEARERCGDRIYSCGRLFSDRCRGRESPDQIGEMPIERFNDRLLNPFGGSPSSREVEHPVLDYEVIFRN